MLLPHTIVAAPTYIQFDATRVAISPQQKECTENMFLGGLKSGSNASLSCFKGNIDFFTVINANQHISNCLILDYYDGQYVVYSDRCNKRNRYYCSDAI